MDTKDKSTIQELLSILYLRLNGYFTTGFIIHSDTNKIESELDIVAVRFPGHKQDSTEHNSSVFLEVPNNIDIIIGEVKASGQQLQFNNCLKQQNTVEPWQKLLEWIGVFSNIQITLVANELNSLVQSLENSNRPNLLSTKVIASSFGNLTVRPILFSPERISNNNSDKFITWTELNDFIWLCLCPAEKRESCGTRYDFTSWGHGLKEIVKVYKGRQKAQSKLQTIKELYEDIKKNRQHTEKLVQLSVTDIKQTTG